MNLSPPQAQFLYCMGSPSDDSQLGPMDETQEGTNGGTF